MRFKRHTLTVGLLTVLAALAVGSPRAAFAQTFTWNNATGNWSDPTKWVGGVGPVGTTAFGADTLNFGDAGGAAYTATNDFTDGDTLSPAFFNVNKINLNSTVAGSKIAGIGTNGFPTVPLLFVGPNPSINQTGTGSFAIEHTIAVASTLDVNVAANAGQLRLGIASDTAADGNKQPTLAGSGSVTITNNSTNAVLLGLSAGTIADANNPAGRVGGFQGMLNIAGTGTVRLTQSTTNDGAVPTAAPIVALTKLVHLNVASGATFDFNGQDERIGTLSGGGTVVLGAAYLVFDGRRDQDWSGSITGGTPIGTFNAAEPTILKPFTNGRETDWTWRGNNSYTGDTDLRGGGTVRLVDGGRISGTSDESDVGDEAIHIFRTELILDNTGTQNLADRVRDAAAIQLAGGITLLGAADANSSETLGAINVSAPPLPPEENGVTHPAGAATLTVVNGAGHTATLTLASLARTTAAGASLDFAGDGDVVITAAPTPTNGIIGGWATKGTEWATITGTKVTPLATYETSDVPANAAWAAASNVKIDGPLTGNVTASKTINSLNVASNQTLTIDAAQTLTIDSGGVLASTSGSIAGPGSLTAAGQGDAFARELRFHVVGAGNTLTVASTIVNSGTGMVLTKTGDGVLKLTGTNAYGTPGAANQTNFYGGVVEIAAPTNLGLGGFMFSGGTLRLAANVDLSATTRQIRTAGVMTVDTNGFNFSSDKNPISGYGSIVKKGAGTWVVNGGNTFDGDVYIEQGTLQSSTNNVGTLFDSTTFVHISAGATLDLNNNNEDFGGPLGEGTVLTGNSAATGVAYTSTNPPEDALATFNGKIMGAGYLDSRSNHKVSLGGQSSFAGRTTIQTGGFIVTANVMPGADGPLGNTAAGSDRTIVLGTSGANALPSSLEIGAAGVEIGRDIRVNPGTASSIGSTHTTGSSTYSGAISLSKMLYVTAAGTSTLNLSGAITNVGPAEGGGLTKIGPGTLVLSGTNTYTSGTYVAEGKLLVNGANNGTGAVTVATGATLGGTGTIAAPITVFGTLAPGASVGTLGVTNSVKINGTLAAEVSGATIDKLSITGALSLGTASVLDILGTLDGAATYVIATYNAGTLTGKFADATDATTHGYSVVYGDTELTLDELDGDSNHDGVVNIFDINLVSSNWNPTGPVDAFSPGNVNHDGVVNIFDINMISSNWNTTTTNGTAAAVQPVPEPSTLVIALLGLAGILAYRRPRSAR